METIVVASGNNQLCRRWDHIIDTIGLIRDRVRINAYPDPVAYLKERYKEYYIKDIVLFLENEIVRHEKYLEIKYFPYFFRNENCLRKYIHDCEIDYLIYRKKIEKLLQEYFKDCYQEAKEEWNTEAFERLESTNWRQCNVVQFVLPKFFNNGKHGILKDKDWDFKNRKYTTEL